MMKVVPVRSWMFTSSNCVASRRFLSSAESGSSNNNNLGRFASARARATRAFCPPESCAGRRSPKPSMRVSASISVTRAAMAGFGIPSCFRPKAMFWATLIWGNSA